MDRHAPDPLKQIRQNQAPEAKALSEQNGQRTCAMKKKEKHWAAETTKKQANADRHKTPIPAVEYPEKEALYSTHPPWQSRKSLWR